MISAALIVKDEAENIRECVESLRNCCDEIVVVDTGSLDKTKEIARKLGCRVYEFEWVHDFSAARNFSIEKCTNPWIVWFDADERLTEENAKKVCDLPFDDFDAFYFQVRSFGEKGGIRWMNSRLRLFKADAGFLFSKPVHEDVAYIDGLRYHYPEIYVEHLGYMDRDKLSVKHRRNADILEAYIERNQIVPSEAYYQLATEYFSLGLSEEAREQYIVFTNVAELNNEHSELRMLAFLKLARYAASEGHNDDCLEYIERAEQSCKTRPEPPLHKGDYWRDKGLNAAAYINHYRRAVQLAEAHESFSGVVMDVAFFTYLPYMRLGDAYVSLGRYKEAQEQFESALVFDQNYTEAIIKLAECLEKQGKNEEGKKMRSRAARILVEADNQV